MTTFHAEKPTLTTHPVNGGDALMFMITPPPPQWWWRAMRHHAGASPALIRPWDQEHEGRIAVVSPSLENLTAVIDAINAAVAQSNTDYEHGLALQRDSAKRLKTEEAKRHQYLSDIRDAIDQRYEHHTGAIA
jgi:hypothetical protein